MAQDDGLTQAVACSAERNAGALRTKRAQHAPVANQRRGQQAGEGVLLCPVVGRQHAVGWSANDGAYEIWRQQQQEERLWAGEEKT